MPEFQAPAPETLAPMYDAVFAMVASRAGDHWKLSPTESGELARLSHVVIMKYGAAFAERYGPEIMLGGYLLVIIGSRVWTTIQVQRERETREFPAIVAETPQA